MSRFPQSVLTIGSRFPLWIAAVGSIILWSGNVSTAFASCGDYLHQTPPTRGVHAFLFLETPADRESAKPCSGPECHQTPAVPPVQLPVDVRSPVTDQLALLPNSTSLFASAENLTRASEQFQLLEEHRAGLDRPPRSV